MAEKNDDAMLIIKLAHTLTKNSISLLEYVPYLFCQKTNHRDILSKKVFFGWAIILCSHESTKKFNRLFSFIFRMNAYVK